MRRYFSAVPRALAAATLAFAIAAATIAAAPARAEPAAAFDGAAIDRAKLFDAVIATVERRFVDERMLKETGWRGRAEEARAAILSAGTTEEAVARINALLAELKTSHTALYTPDDVEYYILLDIVGAGPGGGDFLAGRFWGAGPWHAGIGAFTTKIGDRHFVDGVMEGSPADKAGLRYGDEILSVEGQPYSPVAAFRGRAGQEVEIAVRRAEGAPPQALRVGVVPVRPTAAFAQATRLSARVIERNGRRIGYVHLWSVSESRPLQAALAAIDPARDEGRRRRGEGAGEGRRGEPLDSLILDMRGRVGGSLEVAGEMLDLLDRGRRPYWGAIDIEGRSDRRWAQADARPRSGAAARPHSFRGRSVLLIDRHTRSAGEILAYGFRRGDFGPTIGTPTAGAVTSGATEILPGGLLLYVAVSTLAFDGATLEGAGVGPDQRVDRPLPYAAGADPVLEAAIERLSGAPRP